MIDVFSKGITGKDGEKMLEDSGITVNKNTIPFDQNKPMIASGLRLGTPAVTTRGLGEAEVKKVGELVNEVLDSAGDEAVIERVRSQVREMCERFPIYD